MVEIGDHFARVYVYRVLAQFPQGVQDLVQKVAGTYLDPGALIFGIFVEIGQDGQLFNEVVVQ